MTSQLRHLLLIDDELLLTAAARRLVRGMQELTTFGLSDDMAVANSGRQALAYIAQALPDSIGLVILDASLPDVYGVDLLRMLVSHNYPSLQGCRFVVWSSWECQEEAQRQGAHGYISKIRSERHPFKDDLLTMLTMMAHHPNPQKMWCELGPFG